MAETFCVKHPGKSAVGYCSKCNKPYCEDCLDMETGKPVCHDCLKLKSSGGAPVPPPTPAAPLGGSPLNFKGKGLDDDPLGLFSGGGAPKMEPPKLNPLPSSPKPPISPIPPPKPASSSMPNLDKLGASPFPGPATAPTPKPSMDLDSLINEPQPLRPPFPTASTPSQSSAAPPPPTSSSGSFSKPRADFRSFFGKIENFFVHLSWKLKIPFYALVGGLLLVVGLVVAAVLLSSKPSPVVVVDSIQPIHFIQVNSGQISEMDITAYTDLQNGLHAMGFQPVLQTIIPQLPSPNFFDVGMKEDTGTYSEIIKTPGQITPHLSFVSVFTNGVWFSTNAWQGTNQNLEYLVSEFYPSETPDQLYVQHIQTLEKLKKEKEWQVQTLSENRYIAALSDHLRWFLDKKGIPAYQADFAWWH